MWSCRECCCSAGHDADRKPLTSAPRSSVLADPEVEAEDGSESDLELRASLAKVERAPLFHEACAPSQAASNSQLTREFLEMAPKHAKSPSTRDTSAPNSERQTYVLPAYRHRRMLQDSDMMISDDLKQRLGVASEGPPSPSAPSQMGSPGDNQRRSSMGSLRHSSETSPTSSDALNVRLKPKLSVMALIYARMTAFRKRIITTNTEPTEQCVDRGVHIEGIYDFYAFGGKRLRMRRMRSQVFHERFRRADDDEEDESYEYDLVDTRSFGTEQEGSDGDSSDSLSAFTRESSLKSSSSGKASSSTNSQRKGFRASLRKAVGRHSGQEAVAHWGILVGRLLHTKLLDFQTAAQKAIRFHKRKQIKMDSPKFRAFNSVRERARLVAKQAWHLSRQVGNEPCDAFDRDWEEQDLLVKLFSTECEDTLTLFCTASRKILAEQPMLAEVKAPCKVFGDIHGQLRDLLLLFAAFGSPDEHGAPVYVFNGDFVDRGTHSIEVIGLLMALKILLPERVWLIRGNHEDRTMNRRYGFYDECVKKLGESGKHIFKTVQRVFDHLPVACLISDRILVMHGGIGDGRFTLEDLRHISRPMKEDFYTKPENLWIFNLLWSDPIEDDDTREGGVFGVHKNPRSDLTSRFGWNVTKTFCARHGLSLIVRSHQSKQGSPGFDVMHDKMLMRIFSARDYEGHGNDGAVLYIQESQDAKSPGLLKVRPQVLRSTAKAHEEQLRRITEDFQMSQSISRSRGLGRNFSAPEVSSSTQSSTLPRRNHSAIH
mmetsp:Transcript_45816/g.106454  ORF Transcript_45816/g.106454 Transcript_45816/m.106454 type:complete len:770 (+) Transcript_45816:84-2393(+)